MSLSVLLCSWLPTHSACRLQYLHLIHLNVGASVVYVSDWSGVPTHLHSQTIFSATSRSDSYTSSTKIRQMCSIRLPLAFLWADWHWGTEEFRKRSLYASCAPTCDLLLLCPSWIAVAHHWWKCRGFREMIKKGQCVTLRFSSFSGLSWAGEQYYFMAAAAAFWENVWAKSYAQISKWAVILLMGSAQLMYVVCVVDLCRWAVTGSVSGNSRKQNLFFRVSGSRMCCCCMQKCGQSLYKRWVPPACLVLAGSNCHLLNKQVLLRGVCFNQGGKLQRDGPQGMAREGNGLIL